MKKLLLTLVALMLTCVGAYATEVTYKASGLTETSGKYVWSPDGTLFNFTLDKTSSGTTNPTYNTTKGDIRLYAGGTLHIASKNGETITKIVFNISEQGKKRLAQITSSVGEIAAQTKGGETVTWTGNASDVTFTVGDKAEYGSDGAAKAGQLCYSSLTITYGTGGSDLESVTLAWSATAVEVNLNELFNAPTLTVTPAAAESKVVYSSSVTSVADFENGELKILAAGKTTIKAEIPAGDKYSYASAKYDLTVIDPNAHVATFDFSVSGAYGLVPTSDSNHYDSEDVLCENDPVALTISGKYRQWSSKNSFDLRVYFDSNSAGCLAFSVPAGYAITSIEFTGSKWPSASSQFDQEGTWNANDHVWTASLSKGVSSVKYTAEATTTLTSINVNYIELPKPVAPTLHADTPWPSDNRLATGAQLKYTVDKGFIQVRVVERPAGAPQRVASSVTEQGTAPANWEYLDAKTAVYTHPELAEGESLPVYDVVNVHNGEESVPTRLELTADGGVSGIVDVTVDGGDAEYYNLQGVRVENPAPGLYIRRQGDTYTKVLVK